MTTDEFRMQLHAMIKQLSADQDLLVRNIAVEWMGPFNDAPYILGLVDIEFAGTILP